MIKDKKNKGKFYIASKILSWIVMGFLVVIGSLLLVYVVINKVYDAKGETPPIGLFTIISPSMTPNIGVYDVVFVKKTDPKDIQIGDVISYYSTNEYFGGIPITHRVVEKFSTDNGITFRTKGDANPVVDDEIIMSNNVVGVVKFVIPQLGRIQFFIASKFGWLIVVLLPALGILIYDILKLIKLVHARQDILAVRNSLGEKSVTKKKTTKKK